MKKIAIVLCLVLSFGIVAPKSSFSLPTFAGEVEPASDVVSSEAVGEAEQATPAEAQHALSEEAKADLQAIVAEWPIMALVYLSETYSIKDGPSESGSEVASVPSGQQVFITGMEYDEYGNLWAKVEFYQDEVLLEGYVQRDNLAVSDERFLSWETQHNVVSLAPMPMMAMAYSAVSSDVAQFPASYQASLTALKNAHPNWIFVPMNTGLDWNTVVSAQMEGARSLVPNSFSDEMKIAPYGTQGWSYASEYAVEYYLDPRNWLDDTYVFQFEQLTFNPSYHTVGAVQTMLNGSFMAGTVPGDGRSYAQLFWDIGSSMGVSPFHLASRAYHEQGVHGSTLISGTYPGYEGLYNYYNISAAGSTTTAVITSGLQKAREMGWTSHTSSIQGGASIISQNYILQGQDTLYLQKFDVDPSYNGLYWHQYMQSLFAPSSEGKQIRNLYAETGALESTFVFKIPVYTGMPGSTHIGTTSGTVGTNTVSLTVPPDYDASKIYLDGVEYAATLENGQAIAAANGTGARTATMYQYDANGVPRGMYVWLLSNAENTYTATPVPELQDLLSYHGFSIRTTGNSGIRFKSGIGTDARAALATTGLGNFTVAQYGTLVMTEANRANHAFVLGGEKVAGGMAFEMRADGSVSDAIFAVENGRIQYTSVLVDLPADQYRTEFAFRSYIVLNSFGQEYVFYGPPRSNSIYNIAEQFVNSGYYAGGSSEDVFLRQIMQSAA